MEERAVYTKEEATDIVFSNITVYRQYRDGAHYGYEVRPKEGYVMYDTTDENYDYDPETGSLIPATHYFTLAGFPANFDFDGFTWVAVARAGVDENYIFGS